jgi:hypothetical protein
MAEEGGREIEEDDVMRSAEFRLLKPNPEQPIKFVWGPLPLLLPLSSSFILAYYIVCLPGGPRMSGYALNSAVMVPLSLSLSLSLPPSLLPTVSRSRARARSFSFSAQVSALFCSLSCSLTRSARLLLLLFSFPYYPAYNFRGTFIPGRQHKCVATGCLECTCVRSPYRGPFPGPGLFSSRLSYNHSDGDEG